MTKYTATHRKTGQILEGVGYFHSYVTFDGIIFNITSDEKITINSTEWRIDKVEPPKPSLYEQILALPTGTTFHIEEPTGRKFWGMMRGTGDKIASAASMKFETLKSYGMFDPNDIVVVDYRPEN